MPQNLPSLSLSHGQLAWALSLGQPPTRLTVLQLSYLHTVGIPYPLNKPGHGRGHRVRYGFDQLIECGVALHATRNGMVPREAATYLSGQREWLHDLFRQAYLEQPEDALEMSRRGTVLVTTGMFDLRMHTRYSEEPGKIETVMVHDAEKGVAFGDQVERFADGETLVLVPLTRLVVEWPAWALEAPERKPGPQAGR